MARRRLAVAAILVLAGCPKTPGPVGPTGLPADGPELSTWSETQPVTSLSIAQGALFTTTDTAVYRFDLGDGSATRLAGLVGTKVLAVAADASNLWVATDAGLQRKQAGGWSTVAPAGPQVEATQVMLATEAGVWLGGTRGLHFVAAAGGLKSHLKGARVTVIVRDQQGEGIWVGTDGEGVYRFDGTSFSSHSPAQGQPIRRVRSLGYSGDGGLIAVGLGDGGAAMSFFDGSHWTGYHFSPAGQVRWAMHVGGELMVGYEGRVLALSRLGLGTKSEEAPASPVRVIGTASPRAPAGYPVPSFTTRLVAFRLPVPAAVLGHGGAVWLATGPSGVAAFDGKRVRWYRTRELTGRGERLKLACAPGPGLCYLAGGGGRAYAFDGRVFAPIVVDKEAPNNTVQAFVNDPSGGVLAIHSPEAGQSLLIARLQGKDFVRQQEVKITIPGGKLRVRWARSEPGGKLWLGLEHRDDAPATQPAEGAEAHPWGVVVIDAGATTALYHRSTLIPTEDRPQGSLALPDDIRDVLFAGENWYATANGVCRVRGLKVDLFTENEGLESEIIYAMGRTARGQVLAATHAGLGRFDGKYWRFDGEGPLRTATRALLTRGESVFVGTSRGLVEWSEGKVVRVIDTRAGLASDEVHDLYLEADRRLWVLTSQGLSILPL